MRNNIISLIFHSKKIAGLSEQIEGYARRLNQLPPRRSDDDNMDDILSSAKMLLARYVESQEAAARGREEAQGRERVEAVRSVPGIEAAPAKPQPAKAAEIAKSPAAASGAQPDSIAAQQGLDEPSSTAKELIKLRDWLIMARQGDGGGVSAATLEGLYKRLGQILKSEGVISLEDNGPCNFDRQRVVDTVATDDPQQDNCVSSTLRPGYLFRDQVYRPQEVVVYQYREAGGV